MSAEKVSQGSESAAQSIGDAFRGIHGIGESIRGAVKTGADDLGKQLFGEQPEVDAKAAAENKAILKRGEEERARGLSALESNSSNSGATTAPGSSTH
ncbi:hypothetical protein PYCC9005_001378 [Savitreella phatthalungensis]